MPRGFVLVDNVLINHAVDHGDSLFIGGLCGIFVTSITGLDDIFDFRTHHGAQAHIGLAGLFRLAGAFPG